LVIVLASSAIAFSLRYKVRSVPPRWRGLAKNQSLREVNIRPTPQFDADTVKRDGSGSKIFSEYWL
jgi:hypothetical protein